jgi:hypothetical protein
VVGYLSLSGAGNTITVNLSTTILPGQMEIVLLNYQPGNLGDGKGNPLAAVMSRRILRRKTESCERASGVFEKEDAPWGTPVDRLMV